MLKQMGTSVMPGHFGKNPVICPMVLLQEQLRAWCLFVVVLFSRYLLGFCVMSLSFEGIAVHSVCVSISYIKLCYNKMSDISFTYQKSYLHDLHN